MVSSEAGTPDEYIATLPEDRRAAIEAVRSVIRENLPDGYDEGMQFGMIAWYVPLETFPDTYNGQPLGLAALASQKNYMSLYLNSVYGDRDMERWFKERSAALARRSTWANRACDSSVWTICPSGSSARRSRARTWMCSWRAIGPHAVRRGGLALRRRPAPSLNRSSVASSVLLRMHHPADSS